MIEHSEFAGRKLLDSIKEAFWLKNDADLSRFLLISPANICKIRSGVSGVSPQTVIDVHLATNWPVKLILQKVAE